MEIWVLIRLCLIIVYSLYLITYLANVFMILILLVAGRNDQEL